MSQPHWEHIEQFLHPLCTQGLFVSIFGWNDMKTLIVDCELYFTDTDENGNPARLFCVDSVEKLRFARDAQNRCICCEQNTLESGPTRYQRGSIMCPICSAWTKPGTLRQRSFRGLFHFAAGEVPFFVGPGGGDKCLPAQMTNAEQIEAITAALLSVELPKSS
jgi:hypothetical protein